MKKILSIVCGIALALYLIIPMAFGKTCVCECPDVSVVTVQKDVKGRVSVWSEITTDSDGVVIKKRVEAYSYKPSGQIDRIDQKVFDGKNALIKHRAINHYPDKQPLVENISIEPAPQREEL